MGTKKARHKNVPGREYQVVVNFGHNESHHVKKLALTPKVCTGNFLMPGSTSKEGFPPPKV